MVGHYRRILTVAPNSCNLRELKRIRLVPPAGLEPATFGLGTEAFKQYQALTHVLIRSGQGGPDFPGHTFGHTLGHTAGHPAGPVSRHLARRLPSRIDSRTGAMYTDPVWVSQRRALHLSFRSSDVGKGA